MTYDTGAESFGSSPGGELAFKLLAAHAIADDQFFLRLRDHPREAAAEIHIHLSDDDVAFLGTLDWAALANALPAVRAALHLDITEASW